MLIAKAALLASVMAAQSTEWIPLFDGKSLNGWKQVEFSGHGQVQVQNGEIRLGKGRMTGIALTGEFPRSAAPDIRRALPRDLASERPAWKHSTQGRG